MYCCKHGVDFAQPYKSNVINRAMVQCARGGATFVSAINNGRVHGQIIRIDLNQWAEICVRYWVSLEYSACWEGAQDGSNNVSIGVMSKVQQRTRAHVR